MPISIVAALIHVASLSLQWCGGIISIENPRQARAALPGGNLDRHSSTVWDVANGLALVGLILGFVGVGRFTVHGQSVALVGLVLLIVGIAIRWTAILSLGRFFTGVVTIQTDHVLVRRGPYRYVRHPAYTGTLMSHLGLGLAFASWVSIAMSTIPFLVAAVYRIRIEEDALRHAFGATYSNYAKDTWRLVPWVH